MIRIRLIPSRPQQLLLLAIAVIGSSLAMFSVA